MVGAWRLPGHPSRNRGRTGTDGEFCLSSSLAPKENKSRAIGVGVKGGTGSASPVSLGAKGGFYLTSDTSGNPVDIGVKSSISSGTMLGNVGGDLAAGGKFGFIPG